jgi:hypothetical protein
MFRIRSLVLVLGVLLLCSSGLSAQESNVWGRNSPRRIKGGGISISGTATPGSGYTLSNSGLASAWLTGRKGGIVTTFPITVTVDPVTGVGTWSATLTGLTPATHYVIVVQVTESQTVNCVTTTQTIATEPKTVERPDDD